VQPDLGQPLSGDHLAHPLGQRAGAVVCRHAAGRRGDGRQRVRVRAGLADGLQERRGAHAAGQLDGDLQRRLAVRHQRPAVAAAQLLQRGRHRRAVGAVHRQRQLRRLPAERGAGVHPELAGVVFGWLPQLQQPVRGGLRLVPGHPAHREAAGAQPQPEPARLLRPGRHPAQRPVRRPAMTRQTMTRQTIKFASLAAALALAGAVHAQDATLLPAARGDVALRTLATDAPATPPSPERAPVHFAWALPADAPALAAPAPYTAASREYWKDVDGAALARGVTIHTTAPGALVLISPAGEGSRAVAPGVLQVRQGGRAIAAKDATVALAPQAALEAATGANFAPGALGFRLAPALGAGAFELQVPDARGRYVVHVREPDSAVALRVENP